MSKSKEMNMEKLGKTGEMIIANACMAAGQKVILAEDQYDSEKDMLIDGLKVEVKTQVPYHNKNCFSFKPNQLKKCKSVDRVIFIAVPNDYKPHFSDGKVYMIRSDELQHFEYVAGDNRKMIGVPIKQPGMKVIYELDDNQKRLLQKCSVSERNNRV